LMSNDTTICQGDTIVLQAFSLNAMSYAWTRSHNLESNDKDKTKAWPDHNVTYHITLPYPNGCVVDTAIHVTVNRIHADAGPDRTLSEGASTMIGGPFTSLSAQFAYNRLPAQYISNSISLNPVVKPPYDFTYYLVVQDTAGCQAMDAVNITVPCDGIS